MPEKKGLDLETLKQVIQIMEDHNISEVCIEQGETKVQVKRTPDQPDIATQGAAMLTEKMVHIPVSRSTNSSDDLAIISAPMVGTFYRATSPEAEPFVNVGDEIKTDQVICIIDAMKLMNEITADLDGEIAEILVEDGQAVEYDQPMFRVRPKKK